MLVGAAAVEVETGGKFADPGANAADAKDGLIPPNKITVKMLDPAGKAVDPDKGIDTSAVGLCTLNQVDP